jgi:hypothetical protein
MFEQVATALLKGEFICASTAPNAFGWLAAPDSASEVSAYLSKIGRRLSKTPNGLAYYATWESVGSDQRLEVKRVFAAIKQNVRPVIHFLTFCMEAEKRDSAPAAGDRLEFALLLKAVTENSHLYEMLREFGLMGKEFTVSDASPNGMLRKVVQQLEKWGYLILINREQESYRFTGKLDYYYQVMDFLLENEGDIATDAAADSEEAQGIQGQL